MNTYSKAARKYLKESTREEFERTIYSAKLTPMQDKIIRLHILEDRPVCYIAMKLILSEATIRRALSEIYLRVSRALIESSRVPIPAII